ncbi:MAG: hypothetical protein PF484_04670 [Bacteroidales bacterium]|jgi:hypothetical protein|nr:hypothetical protein [Bacteroidales bacterium]
MKNYLSDQRTVIFLISLLISSILWLLIRLSGDFQTEHNIYLSFQNLPIDKVLINKPDSVLQIRTNNNGFDVIGQFLFNRNKSLNVDFTNAKFLYTKKGIQTYYFLCSNLRNEIEDEFNTAEQILSIRPDSIVFEFEKLAYKKLKIDPQLDLSFNTRFKQYRKMHIDPDSIVFYGPATFLKSISSIKTQVFKLKDISSNIDTLIRLDLPSNKLIGTQANIKLEIAVEEYTEGKISLPIQLKADSKKRYKTFPSVAQITYQVALIDYTKINSAAFELQAIPDSIESGKLHLKLSRQPDNVIVSNIQPSSAEYIILK